MEPIILNQFHLFASLPESERRELAGILRYIELAEETIICQEGEPGDRMFLVIEGIVEVRKAMGTTEERVLSRINAGDYFGEMSLLERDGHRTATVRSVTAVRLLELTRLEFDNLIHRWPTLALQMLRELSLRLRDTQSATIHDLQQKNTQLAKAYDELKAAQAQIIEKEKLERELQLAQQIQMSMLPDALPETHGFEFGARILPARAVGGDLYDFVPLRQMSSIGLLIGDVSDKGVPAALFMALTRSLLRAEASLGLPPVEVLQKVNNHLLGMNKANMFVTMLYGVLVPETGEFMYARAGHEVPMMVDSVGNLCQIKHTSGQLIGIFPTPLLDQESITIPHGGALLLFTDGASDSSNSEREFFGHERLAETFQKAALEMGSAQDICNQVFDEIIRFQGAAAQIDDITLVVVKSKG